MGISQKTKMQKHHPKTLDLLNVSSSVLRKGAYSIHYFISYDKKNMVAIIETPLGAKRIKYQTNTLEQDINILEKGLSDEITTNYLNKEQVIFTF